MAHDISEYNQQETMDDSNEEITEVTDKKNIGDLNSAIVVALDWTIETIYTQINKGNIDLNPAFQRRNVWNIQKKSRLIESILMGIPIPQLLLAERLNERNKYIVLDGKQRLLAIKEFLDCYYEKDESFIMKGLTVFTEFNEKKAYEILTEGARKSENILDFAVLGNSSIRTVFIRNWPSNDYLYQVFNRLNTGATPLAPQELRNSLYPGKFTEYILRVSSDPVILELLNLQDEDKRMRDVELVQRFYSYYFYANEYKGTLKAFLDSTADKLNKQWPTLETDISSGFCELKASIDMVKKIYGDLSFRNPKNKSYTIIKPLFEVLTYYFAKSEVRQNIFGLKPEAVAAYNRLFEDPEFIDSITSHTSDLVRVKYRFEAFCNSLNSLFENANINLNVKNPFKEPYGE